MENPKRHKRSGSVLARVAAPSLPRLKKSSSGKAFGKFQGSTKHKPEKKNFDTSITSLITTLPSLATVNRMLVNGYTAGTGGTNTLGRKVQNQSILVRMTICQPTVSGVTTVGPTGCRVIVVYDKEANGGAPAASDVFSTTADNSSVVMNLNNSQRFTILMDEKFTLAQLVITAAPASACSSPTTYMIDRYIKCKLDSIALTTFNGTVTNILTGSIYLLAFSDTAAGSNPPVITSGVVRVRFLDN